MATSVNPVASGACPSFFRASCREASQGGTHSYRWAGYGLARALGGLSPLAMEEDEWQVELDKLSSAICPDNNSGRVAPPSDQAVLAWFKRWLPRCMALVPAKRQRTFLQGVYEFVRHEENELTI